MKEFESNRIPTSKKVLKPGQIFIVNLGNHKDRTYSGEKKLCMFLWNNGCKCKVIPITSRYNSDGEAKNINDIDILVFKGEGNLDKDSILLLSDDKTVDISNISKFSIGCFSDRIIYEVKLRWLSQLENIGL